MYPSIHTDQLFHRSWLKIYPRKIYVNVDETILYASTSDFQNVREKNVKFASHVSQNSRIQALEFPTEQAIPSFPTTLALSSPTPFLPPLPAPLTASEAKTETQLYTTLISIHYDLGDKGTSNAIHSEHIINSARSTWELVVEKRIFANHIFPNVQAHRLLDWIKNLIWTFLEDLLFVIISLYQVLALTFLNFVLQKGNRINDLIIH